MAKHQIKHRRNESVLFECDVPDDMASGLRTRHALKKAMAADASLAGANLADASLTGASLTGASLTGACLTGACLTDACLASANLIGANLADACLIGANLIGANLAGANLTDACLIGANLIGANLASANLTDACLIGANLIGANLTDACLASANLTGADLTGAKWRNGIVINKPPIQLFGLHWRVTILDSHMQIGCELHALADWAAYDDKRIAEMGGREALRFWRAHKDVLLSLAASADRDLAAVPDPSAS